VSLVKSPCDHAENNLKILNVQPVNGVKKQFGVCTKQVSFENRESTIKFIEWTHLIRLLGAEKIHFSYKHLHPEFLRIVKHFEEQGIVETWPYFDHSGIPDTKLGKFQTRMVEMNMITDCFYRVKNLYDYVAVLDFDEVIMPVNEADMTWHDILKRVNASGSEDFFGFQNLYYPEVGAKLHKRIPKYMNMLQHTQRSQNFTKYGVATKSFVGTERVKTVHNHTPKHCIKDDNSCSKISVSTSIAQSSHYRTKVGKGTTFNVTKEDKTIWKFKDSLIKAVQQTLSETGFEP
jgi:Glycosyltransferase family 92